jgi:hypothetical protein
MKTIDISNMSNWQCGAKGSEMKTTGSVEQNALK